MPLRPVPAFTDPRLAPNPHFSPSHTSAGQPRHTRHKHSGCTLVTLLLPWAHWNAQLLDDGETPAKAYSRIVGRGPFPVQLLPTPIASNLSQETMPRVRLSISLLNQDTYVQAEENPECFPRAMRPVKQHKGLLC